MLNIQSNENYIYIVSVDESKMFKYSGHSIILTNIQVIVQKMFLALYKLFTIELQSVQVFNRTTKISKK